MAVVGRAGHVLVDSTGADPQAVQQWLADNANVSYFEPNAILTTQVIPNDTSFSSLWGLHNTGQSGGNTAA